MIVTSETCVKTSHYFMNLILWALCQAQIIIAMTKTYMGFVPSTNIYQYDKHTMKCSFSTFVCVFCYSHRPTLLSCLKNAAERILLCKIRPCCNVFVEFTLASILFCLSTIARYYLELKNEKKCLENLRNLKLIFFKI